MKSRSKAALRTRGMRRPTIRDVARKAGVSTTTVSDALNGRGRLPSATREHVSRIATQLGYSARASARRLREGRTGQIALYCPFLGQMPGNTAGDGYYLQLAMGAADASRAQQLALLLLPPNPTPDQLKDIDVDGLIVADPLRNDPGLAAFARRGIPVVTCSRDLTPRAKHAGCVETEDEEAIGGLLDHLVIRGAQRIALISPGRETAWGDSLARGYDRWCAEHMMARRRVEVPVTPDPGGVEQASLKLLATRARVDAIISAVHFGVFGVLRAAEKCGLVVPADVLVATCTDDATMQTTSPPVTAIDLQPTQMGRQLALMLGGLLEGSVPIGAHEVLPTKLVVRASTLR